MFSLTGSLVPIFGPFRRVAQQPEGKRMPTLAQSLSPLPFPAFAGMAQKTYAAWPVWSDSTTKEIKYQPMPRKAATRLWHRARDFDRQTRRKAHHGGAVGPSALQVLHTLIFDFLNFRSGQLDPSYAAIARKANVCERTVATAIQRLKSLGILNWVRRCAESRAEDGRFVLEQETNAYAVLPASQWRGYREPPEAPPPAPTPPAPSRPGRPPKPGGKLSQVEIQRAYRARLAAAGKVVRIVDAATVSPALVNPTLAAMPEFDPVTHFVCERAVYEQLRYDYNNALLQIERQTEDLKQIQLRNGYLERDLRLAEQHHTIALKDNIVLKQQLAEMTPKPAKQRRVR
jgi:hypothetical protein